MTTPLLKSLEGRGFLRKHIRIPHSTEMCIFLAEKGRRAHTQANARRFDRVSPPCRSEYLGRQNEILHLVVVTLGSIFIFYQTFKDFLFGKWKTATKSP